MADDGSLSEPEAMRLAIVEAARALGSTSPNPPVGCIVLDGRGRVAGRGFTSPPGGPHAEINALRDAGDRARGGTAVVTLEPCAHHGRTPPCTRALIDAGVARVVYAVADPNPVAAGGASVLRAAGVDVAGGLLEAEAALGNEAWLGAIRLGRPFVTWKLAASVDGRVAAADGSSRWVTGPEARADVHRLRAENDAVVVGSGTIRADDPHLTVRDAPVVAPPLRVVVDTEATTPVGARVLDPVAPTLIAVAADAATPAHFAPPIDVARLPRGAGGLDLAALLAALCQRGVRAVLLEGGPTLAGSFVAAGLVDRVVAYLAPVVIGAGLAAVVVPGNRSMRDAWRLRLDEVVRIGSDIRIVARPQNL